MIDLFKRIFWCNDIRLSFLKRIVVVLLQLYIFMIPFEFVFTVASKSIIAIIGGITIFVSLIYGLLNLKNIKIKNLFFLLPWLIYLMLYLVSFFYTHDRYYFLYFLKMYGSNILFISCIFLFVNLDKNDIKKILQTVILTGIVISVFLLFFSTRIGNERRTIGVFGTYIDPNYLGIILVISFVLLIIYFFNNWRANKFISLISLFLSIAMLISLFLTGSRTFIIAIAFVFLIYLIYMMAFKRKFLFPLIAIVVLVFGYLVVYLLLPDSLKIRFSIPGLLGLWETDNNVGRVAIWRAILKAFPVHPLLGWGGGSTLFLSEQYYGFAKVAHNSFIEALLELGLVGLSFVVFWFTILFVKSFKNRNFLQSSFLTICFIYCFFLSTFSIKAFWLLVLISCICNSYNEIIFSQKMPRIVFANIKV